MPRIKYETALKVQAMTRLLQENEPISSICDDLRLSPLVVEQWRKEVVGGLPILFDKELKKEDRAKDKQIAALKREVVRKQEVIGELMEAFTQVKKRMGKTDRLLGGLRQTGRGHFLRGLLAFKDGIPRQGVLSMAGNLAQQVERVAQAPGRALLPQSLRSPRRLPDPRRGGGDRLLLSGALQRWLQEMRLHDD